MLAEKYSQSSDMASTSTDAQVTKFAGMGRNAGETLVQFLL